MRNYKIEEADKSFVSMGFLWDPCILIFETGRKEVKIGDPLCPKCRTQMEIDPKGNKGVCINPLCKKEIAIEVDIQKVRQIVHRKYEAYLRSNKEVVSLDLPPGIVEAHDESENYWIFARIGQKNGKKMGLVWMGEKLKQQSAKDKVQFFFDFDDEQIRIDKGNMPPMKLLAKFEAEFEGSEVRVKRKK